MRQKVLITAALPYANAPLHFGHLAGAYLPADCFARFERLHGKDVLFISGSDEYGVAIALSAEIAGRSPKEHVDLFHEINKEFFKKLCIDFDYFGRTSSPHHIPLVQTFFEDLLESGLIEKRETEELYSAEENKFLADRYVVGTCPKCGFESARGDECNKCGASYEATDLIKPRSKLSGKPLTRKKTTHWFLLFGKMKEKLETFLSGKLWKPNVINFAKEYVDNLKERAITRDLKWGVPVPLEEAEGKVFYVWFDAPIGYISIAQEWAEKTNAPDAWKEYWCDPKTKYVQFMGKDNIPFHALFFPAMIMGQKGPYKLVDDLVANEFYNLEGKKFSKSDGWTIDVDDFFSRFHPDQIRYAIAANAPESSDSEFSWRDFEKRCNGELVGKLGNLINRSLTFLQNHLSGKVPPRHFLGEEDLRFENEMHRLLLEIEESFESYKLRRACQLIMELASQGNAYFDAKAPWKEARDPARKESLETTLSLCLSCIKNLALVCAPLMPKTAERILEQLALKSFDTWKAFLERELVVGTALPKPTLLFQKIEDGVIDEEISKLKKRSEMITTEKKTDTYAPIKPAITIDEMHKMDLRVGLILSAEKVPKAKKLLKLEVDLGFEKRTILSGISLHYTPEQLVGKKVIVVANLKPATIMGIESQGMILAASIDDKLEVLSADIPIGASVS